MSVSYQDFIAVAERLLNLTPEESDSVEARSSISRAYYFIFHHIRERFNKHPKANFKYDTADHREVIEFLKRISERTLSSEVRKLRMARNDADYVLNTNFTKASAKNWLYRVRNYKLKLDAITPF